MEPSELSILEQIYLALLPLISSAVTQVITLVIASMVAGRSALIKLLMLKVEKIITEVAQDFFLDEEKRLRGHLPLDLKLKAKQTALEKLEAELTESKGLATFTTQKMRSKAIDEAVKKRNKEKGLRRVDLNSPRTKGM